MNDVWYRFSRNKLAVFGLVVIGLYLVCALGARWIAPYDPYEMRVESVLREPGAEHWLGADPFGRDMFSRIVHGSRISLRVGLIAVSIALSAGTVLGMLAGYFGRWIDGLLSRVVDVMFSFPDILLALVIMAILGPSTTNVMIAIGIVYTPIFARIARGSVLSVKNAMFVEAARAIGVGHFMIMFRHILPNILAPLIIQTTLSFAFAILAEAALSFLGLGVEPDAPSWGIMLNEGKNWMEHGWWVAVFPGVAITLAVLSFNVVGDGLRDALDPKLRGRGD